MKYNSNNALLLPPPKKKCYIYLLLFFFYNTGQPIHILVTFPISKYLIILPNKYCTLKYATLNSPIVFIRIPYKTNNPFTIIWSHSSSLAHTALAIQAVVHRPPSKPQVSNKLLHATRAARTFSAPCVGRYALSPPCLVSTPTQTLLHRGPSRAPTLTDSSCESPIVPPYLHVTPQDCHTQEEPLHLLWAAPKLVLTAIVAVHCHDH